MEGLQRILNPMISHLLCTALCFFNAVVGFLPRMFVTPFTSGFVTGIFSKEMHGEMIRFVVRRLCLRNRGDHSVVNE